MNKDEITCRFTDHKVRKENYFPYFKYTLYDIKVEYKDLSWTIHRRYNEFLVLHNKIKTLIINIPFMPIKCLFAKRKKVIDERILFLENYLNSVLKILNEQVFENIYEDLFNFLCLDNIENHSKLGEIENMTTSENSFEISSSFMTPYFRASIEINGISYNSIIISNFFEKLINEKQDSYLICYDFQVILEKNWFQLTRDNVYYLFYGDNLRRQALEKEGQFSSVKQELNEQNSKQKSLTSIVDSSKEEWRRFREDSEYKISELNKEKHRMEEKVAELIDIIKLQSKELNVFLY